MLFISLPIMLYMVYVSHKQEKINISRKLKKAHLEEQKAKTKKEIEIKKQQNQKDREELKNKKDAHGQMYATPDGRQYNSGDLIRILEQQEKVCPFYSRDPRTVILYMIPGWLRLYQFLRESGRS